MTQAQYDALVEHVEELDAKVEERAAETTARMVELAEVGALDGLQQTVEDLVAQVTVLRERLAAAEEERAALRSRLEQNPAAFHGVDHLVPLGSVCEANRDVNEIALPDVDLLPDDATQVGLALHTRVGNESPNSLHTISLWTVPESKYHLQLWRYGNHAIAFNSIILWLPFDSNTRTLFTQLDKVPNQHNLHGTMVSFAGWR